MRPAPHCLPLLLGTCSLPFAARALDAPVLSGLSRILKPSQECGHPHGAFLNSSPLPPPDQQCFPCLFLHSVAGPCRGLPCQTVSSSVETGSTPQSLCIPGISTVPAHSRCLISSGGKEGGREGGREGGKKEGREGGREGGRKEGWKEGRKEGRGGNHSLICKLGAPSPLWGQGHSD